jgi:hypothetical protein
MNKEVREQAIQELSETISYNLGLLQGEHGMLYQDYPRNFNKIIPLLAETLSSLGYRLIKPESLTVLGEETIDKLP